MNTNNEHMNMYKDEVSFVVVPSNAADASGSRNTVIEKIATSPATIFGSIFIFITQA